MPSGLTIDKAILERQLDRRQGGFGRSNRQQLERDAQTLAITAGLRHGITLGSPIALTIDNADHASWSIGMSIWPTDGQERGWRSRPLTVPRPGHADLAGMARGGFDDGRNVLERASARETAARTAAGAVAQQLLSVLGIAVRSHVRSIGTVSTALPAPDGPDDGWEHAAESDLCCLDASVEQSMREEIDRARSDRDTVGGIVEIVAYGVPIGIGGYATAAERLDGRLAGAAMSVPAIKAVEIGDGFAQAARRGSLAHDEILPGPHGAVAPAELARAANRSGGIEGGMATGQPIVVRAAMKPIPTLMSPLASVDLLSGEAAPAHAERSDVCSVVPAAVVVEAAVAFELATVLREQFGAQALSDVLGAYTAYCERVGALTPATAQ